jgi:hypothetical protein
MSMIRRILASFTIIVGVLIGMLQLDQGTLGAFAVQLQHVPTCYMELTSARNKALSLEVVRRKALHSIEAKKQIACEVAAGRMTLRQAVVQFAEAAKGCPYDWDFHALDHPEWSQNVRYAQYVIYEVESVLHCMMQDSAKVVARLEAEKNAW